MKYYFLLAIAVILGQTFAAVIISWIAQRKNTNITFTESVKLYLKKEQGTFVVILITTISVMFILPDWMDLSTTKEDLLSKEALSRFEKIQLKYRSYAFGFGTFAQLIALVFYQGGLIAIRTFGKNYGVEPEKLQP